MLRYQNEPSNNNGLFVRKARIRVGALSPIKSIDGICTFGQVLPDTCPFGQLMPFRWSLHRAWILLFIGQVMPFSAAILCR